MSLSIIKPNDYYDFMFYIIEFNKISNLILGTQLFASVALQAIKRTQPTCKVGDFGSYTTVSS